LSEGFERATLRGSQVQSFARQWKKKCTRRWHWPPPRGSALVKEMMLGAGRWSHGQLQRTHMRWKPTTMLLGFERVRKSHWN
jgi:hypothetical protein